MSKKLIVRFLGGCLAIFSLGYSQVKATDEPVLKLAVIGLVHDHVHWVFNRDYQDIQVVGIVETNQEAIAKYKSRYGLADSLFFDSYDALMREAQPEAVSAFNETNEHLEVVEYFAPRGIPIMVEKPMATKYEDAKRMVELSRQYEVPLLVNYETSWYKSTYETERMVNAGVLGDITKMVFNTGHMGPKEIGCSPEFLEWLTDSIRNGAGALMDFGCYGANLATWLLAGEEPLRVTAVAQRVKPDIYPNVDDETTIILEYPQKQVVIQASWNWSFHRKDMEVYGTKGAIYALDSEKMNWLDFDSGQMKAHISQEITPIEKDPFRMLLEVVRGRLILNEDSLYGIRNNLKVVKILELAKRSNELGRTLEWEEI
jgi:predicted dehydrogenase